MIEVIDFKLSPYRKIWGKQKELYESLINNRRGKIANDHEYLLIGEHNPVYTLGFHGNSNNMLITQSQLIARNAEFIRIERGGDITYHGPGQLIAYPIIDIEKHRMGIKSYIQLLEECVIELLSQYGIKGEKIDDAIGIWIGKGTPQERKICAIGVKCSHFITMHGLALNVNTDLSAFTAINPCGFVDKGVTSMQQELGVTLDFEKVKTEFIEIFNKKIQ